MGMFYIFRNTFTFLMNDGALQLISSKSMLYIKGFVSVQRLNVTLHFCNEVHRKGNTQKAGITCW